MINKFANYFIDYLLFIEKRFVILPHNQKNIVIIMKKVQLYQDGRGGIYTKKCYFLYKKSQE